MPTELDKAKIKALQKAKAVLEARLRYRLAEKDELLGFDAEQTINFLYHWGPFYRTRVDKLNALFPTGQGHKEREAIAFKLRDDFLIPTEHNLDNLKATLELLDRVKDSEDNILTFIAHLHLLIIFEESELTKQTGDRKQLVAKSSAKAAEEFIPLVEITELYTYQDVRAIAFPLSRPLDQEFVSTYTSVDHQGDTAFIKFNEDFARFLKKREDDIARCKEDLGKLSADNAALVRQLQTDLIGIDAKIVEARNWLKIQNDKSMPVVANTFVIQYQTTLFSVFAACYECKEQLKGIRADISLAKEADANFIREQQAAATRAAEDEKRRLAQQQQLHKNESAQKKRATEEQFAKQKAAEAVKETERLAKREAEQERIQQAEAARKEAIAAALKQRKDDIDAQRLKNEQQKKEFREALVRNQVVTSNSVGKLSSKFKLDDAILIQNCDRLAEVLAPDFKAISFEKAKTLIEQLGGKVTANGRGSSHHKVTFEDTVFAYLENEDSASSISGLPRPHGGETKLRDFALTLFQDAIRSVLTDEWLVKLSRSDKPAGPSFRP